jgi:hypothetical protein
MTRLGSWHGDWHARIYERVRARGFETVTAFADASPRATMFEIVGELGPEDVNVAQFVALMRDEAERTGSVERFARALLVHELWKFVPQGWRVDPGGGFDFEFKAASALATTNASLPDSAGQVVRRLARIMMAADLPVGWLPDGPDDPILVALFERAANDRLPT